MVSPVRRILQALFVDAFRTYRDLFCYSVNSRKTTLSNGIARMLYLTLSAIAVVLFYLVKRARKPKRRKTGTEKLYTGLKADETNRGSREEDESDLTNFRIDVSPGRYDQPQSGNRKPGRWVAPGETVKVGKFEIKRGLFYIGGRLSSTDGFGTESSLLDPTLRINFSSPDYAGEQMDYWPSYDYISPKSRAAYVEWLAGDRSNPDTYIGYVFLYYYGIERRLLFDSDRGAVSQDERSTLIAELRRLKSIYGHNRSFSGYVTSFLSHLWVIHHRGDNEPPSMDLLVAKRNFTSVFKFLLAKSVQSGEHVTKELALAWVKSHPDFNLRTPARRCEHEFDALFKLRYNSRFGDGIIIKPNKTKLRLEYRAASYSLSGNHSIKLDLPDPSILITPFSPINS